MKSPKIVTIVELAAVAERCRANRQRLVLAHGCFDPCHIGHVRYLEEARGHGEVLAVTITPDEFVNKGPNRPAFIATLRAEMLAALTTVDYVAVNEWTTALETIRLVRPAVYAKHAECRDDPSGNVEREAVAVRECGGQMLFVETELFSSSALLNRHMTTTPDAAAKWLKEFPCAAFEITRWLAQVAALKVLCVGDYILDEYVWVKTLGKSGKEPILVVEELRRETHEGGIAAVYAHAKSFCADGSQVIYGNNVMTKTRFVNEYPLQKMYEVYKPKSPVLVNGLAKAWLDCFKTVDLLMIADYGHGVVDADVIKASASDAKFLAVNVQNNAGNHGYNTHEKYGRIDYLCLSEGEIRLAARQRNGDLRQLVEKAAARHECKAITVTRGDEGVLCWGREDGFVAAPAFTSHFADRVGAGDAVLAITSLLVAVGAPTRIVALVANAVGALAVQVVGNRESVTKVALQKFLISLLK
jgi:cytidyltransferase-like protein